MNANHARGLHAVQIRAMFVIIAVILGSSALTTSIGIGIGTREISDTVTDDLLLISGLAFDMTSFAFETLEDDARSLGSALDKMMFEDGDDAVQELIDEQIERDPDFIALSMVKGDDKIMSAEKPGFEYARPNPSDMEYYRSEVPVAGCRIGNQLQLSSGESVFRCYLALDEGDFFMATLPGDYFMETLSASNFNVYENGRLFMVDNTGAIIADTRRADFGHRIDLDSSSSLAQIVNSTLHESTTKHVVEQYIASNGVENICAHSPLIHGSDRWALFLTVPVSDTPVSKLSTVFLISGFLFLFLGCIAAVFLSRIQVKPYIQLNRRNEELAVLSQKAEAASRIKTEFLSNMSHEIRTPLNAVIGMTTIALDSSDPNRKDYCLGKIKDSSRYLLGVINDILDMSKIEANKFELSSIDFDFAGMLRRVSDVMAFKTQEKSLEFTVRYDRQIPPWLHADEQRLVQVLTNLLSNAVKFTDTEGRIDLESNLIGIEDGVATVEFIVSDTGIGITDEQLGHLFSAFTQADNSISRRYGGTGLGLAISKQIVEMMGGGISVQSEPGVGSHFRFTIQATVAECQDVETPETVAHTDFTGKRILLAEDVQINREIVLALLEPTGVKVVPAPNGRKAVDIFKSKPERFDMIFMDMQMPELDGISATREIRSLDMEKARTIPIVAMTANVFKEDVERCIEAGMDDHIGKPLSYERVLEVMQKYLV